MAHSPSAAERLAQDAVARIYVRMQKSPLWYREFPQRFEILRRLLELGWRAENSGVDAIFLEGGPAGIEQALEDFKAIGISQICNKIESACKLFPRGMPSEDDDERMEQYLDMLDRDEKFRDLMEV